MSHDEHRQRTNDHADQQSELDRSDRAAADVPQSDQTRTDPVHERRLEQWKQRVQLRIRHEASSFVATLDSNFHRQAIPRRPQATHDQRSSSTKLSFSNRICFCLFFVYSLSLLIPPTVPHSFRKPFILQKNHSDDVRLVSIFSLSLSLFCSGFSATFMFLCIIINYTTILEK